MDELVDIRIARILDLAGGAPQLITITPPVDASKLPAAAGSVGFPNNFYKTDAARPAAEGAVQ